MIAWTAIAVLLVLVVAACGFGTKGVTSPSPNDTSVWIGQSPPGTSMQRLTIPPTRIGHPGKTVPGRVTVELTKSDFRQGEIVQVVVANGLDQPVHTAGYCGIVDLERRQDSTWESIDRGCVKYKMLRPVLEIGSGEVVEDAIDPHRRQPLVFGEGTYRVAFSYWLATADQHNTVTSPEFAVTR